MGRVRIAKNRGMPTNLYCNKTGYYYYVRPGDRKVKGLGRDKANAYAQARAANAALAENKAVSLADWVVGKQDFTLLEWLPKYRELWMERSAKPPAANTIRATDSYLGKIAEAEYAWRKLSQIETAHIAPHIKLVTDESGPAAAQAMRVRLHDVFRLAETEGHVAVGRNPVAATYAPDRTVLRERLSLEAFLLIRNAAPQWLQNAMNLALVTAQRREDISNMEFSQYKDGYLHVIQGKSQGLTRLQIDGSIRLTAIGMTVEQVVQQCRNNVVSKFMIHHVTHVASMRPGQKVAPGSLSNVFSKFRDQVGVKAAKGRTPPTFHEIRSLAERLYREEYGAAFAQSLLGHKNASMTDKYNDKRGTGWDVVSSAKS